MNLVSFIISLYHDARSSERQNKRCILNSVLLLIVCVTLLVLIFVETAVSKSSHSVPKL